MGPSGSGKTTLLSIIGSRAQRWVICHASHVCIPGTVSAYWQFCRSASIGVMHCSNSGCVSCLRHWYTAQSLSDVLSYTCSAMRRTGAVTFNGQKLNKRFKRQIGFVMQVTQSYIALRTFIVLCLSQCNFTQTFWTASDMAPSPGCCD